MGQVKQAVIFILTPCFGHFPRVYWDLQRKEDTCSFCPKREVRQHSRAEVNNPGPAQQGEEGIRLSGRRLWGKQPELRTWNWQGMETLIVLLGQRVQTLAWQRRLRDVNGIWVEEKGSVELNSMAHRGLYWFCFLKHTCFSTYTHFHEPRTCPHLHIPLI